MAAASPDVGKYVTIGRGSVGGYGGSCLTANGINVQVRWQPCLQPAGGKAYLYQLWKVGEGSSGLPQSAVGMGKIWLQNVGAGLRDQAAARPGLTADNPQAWTWLGTAPTTSGLAVSLRATPEEWFWRMSSPNEFGLWNHNGCKRWYLLDNTKPPVTYLTGSSVGVGATCKDDPGNFMPPTARPTPGQSYVATEASAMWVNDYIAAFNDTVAKAMWAPATTPTVIVDPTLAAYGNTKKVSLTWFPSANVPGKPFTGAIRKDIPIILDVTVDEWDAPLSGFTIPGLEQVGRIKHTYRFETIRYCGQLPVSREILMSVGKQLPPDWAGTVQYDTFLVKARLTVSSTPRCNLIIRMDRV